MSIELENPKTPLEKADALANYLEQMSLAQTIGDVCHFQRIKKKASEVAAELVEQLKAEED